MLSHRPTGQVGRALRAVSLPLLFCLSLLQPGLLAQSPAESSSPKALNAGVAVEDANLKTSGLRTANLKEDDGMEAAVTKSASVAPEPSPPGKAEGGANPAPELDTWLLVGTGVVVLLLLYTRRRSRVLTPAEGRA